MQYIFIQMATKINNLLREHPEEVVFFSSFLASKGITRAEQIAYVRSGWLERMVQGVYKKSGCTPGLEQVVNAYNGQLGKHCWFGAMTSLDFRGLTHYLPMGKTMAYLFTPYAERLPLWIVNGNWNMTVRYRTTSVFTDRPGHFSDFVANGTQLHTSVPERAALESLLLVPEYTSWMDVFNTFESLTTLRPQVLQELLEGCSNVRIKRMFLFMAGKLGYSWFSALDRSRINIGRGLRNLSYGEKGKYVREYDMIVPEELYNYE